MDQPLYSDEVTFADSVDNLYHNGAFVNPATSWENGLEFHLKPPAYVFAAMPFLFLTGNIVLAMKIMSIVLQVLIVVAAYFLLLRFRLSFRLRSLLCVFILVNPWFFFFVRMAVAHGLSSMLILIALYLIFFREKNIFWYCIAGLIFGVAYLARYDPAVFIFAFAIYGFVNILKKRRIKANVLFLIFLLLLPFANTVRDYVVYDTLIPPRMTIVYGEQIDDYADHEVTKDSFYVKMLFTLKNSVKMLFVYLPQYLLFLTPLFFIGIFLLFKSKTDVTRKLKYVLLALGMQLLLFGYFPINNWSALPSIFIPSIILSIYYVMTLRKTFYRAVLFLLLLSLVFSVPVFAYLNYGDVKDVVDTKVGMRPIITQRLEQISDVTYWANRHLPYGSVLLTDFYKPVQESSIDAYYSSLLRKDIHNYMLAENRKGMVALLPVNYSEVLPSRICMMKYTVVSPYNMKFMDEIGEVVCDSSCSVLNSKSIFLIGDDKTSAERKILEVCGTPVVLSEVYPDTVSTTKLFLVKTVV